MWRSFIQRSARDSNPAEGLVVKFAEQLQAQPGAERQRGQSATAYPPRSLAPPSQAAVIANTGTPEG